MAWGTAPGGTDSREELPEFPTATPADSGSFDSESGRSTETPPFSFSIDEIEECGLTCRDVTATVSNNQNETPTMTRYVGAMTSLQIGRFGGYDVL